MDTDTKKGFGFFARIKTSIFKLEDYGKFLEEKIGASIKYFLLLILLISVIISLVSSYRIYTMYVKAKNYIINELPDFSYENGELKFNEYVEGYDEEFDFRIIINTSDITDEEIEQYSQKLKTSEVGAILLKNKAILNLGQGTDLLSEEYSFIGNYNSILNKEELLKNIGASQIISYLITFFIFNSLVCFITQLVSVLYDLFFIAIIAWFIARFCRLRLNLFGAFELSIYSLTLSILLSCVYNCTTILTNFRMEYFSIFYLLVAYVYLIAALFIIKDDLIKQQQELEEIYEVQKEVRKELENEDAKIPEEDKEEPEKKKETEDEKKDDNEEEPNNVEEEPKGSEI